MKNPPTPILAIAFIVATSFMNESGKGYKIIGSAIGFADSTLLYLDDLTDGSFKYIDSTYIINERFIFKGRVESKVIRTAIRTQDFSDRCYIWLENATIYFNAEKGKFKEANVRGTKTNDEQVKFNKENSSSLNKKEQEFLFVQNNPKSIISANILSIYSTSWGRDTTAMLYSNFSKEIKNTYYGRKIQESITLNQNIKIGDKYADFSQKDVKGKDIKISDFKGKVILLEFWGSWCMPCRKGNPELVKIYNEFNSKGFEILGVAADTKKEDWLNAIETDKLPWTNVTDLNGDKNKAALVYGVSYYPTNFLIDRMGTIVARDLTGEKLKEQLKKIL